MALLFAAWVTFVALNLHVRWKPSHDEPTPIVIKGDTVGRTFGEVWNRDRDSLTILGLSSKDRPFDAPRSKDAYAIYVEAKGRPTRLEVREDRRKPDHAQRCGTLLFVDHDVRYPLYGCNAALLDPP